MPGPPPEHPHLRLLKGNPGKRPARSPPQPAHADECPPSPRHLAAWLSHARQSNMNKQTFHESPAEPSWNGRLGGAQDVTSAYRARNAFPL